MTTLTAAPPHETLEQVRDRLVRHALSKITPQQPEIHDLIALYDRRIGGDEPPASDWKTVRDALASDSDRALDLALALDALALALDFDIDLARALDLDLATLLGDRVAAIPDIDAQIIDDLESKKYSLYMGNWHGKNECGTTHCRAGSAVVKHPMGPELERVFGPALAGAVIYLAARRGTNRENQVPEFYASNDAALADIRACAAEQRGVKS